MDSAHKFCIKFSVATVIYSVGYFGLICLSGTILLDLEETDFPHIINAIVEEMIDVGQIKEKNRQDVLRALLLKHRWEIILYIVKFINSSRLLA